MTIELIQRETNKMSKQFREYIVITIVLSSQQYCHHSSIVITNLPSSQQHRNHNDNVITTVSSP